MKEEYQVSCNGLTLDGKTPDITIAIANVVEDGGNITNTFKGNGYRRIVGFYFGNEKLPLETIIKMGLDTEPIQMPIKTTKELVYFEDVDSTIILEYQENAKEEFRTLIAGFHNGKPNEKSFDCVGCFYCEN